MEAFRWNAPQSLLLVFLSYVLSFVFLRSTAAVGFSRWLLGRCSERLS